MQYATQDATRIIRHFSLAVLALLLWGFTAPVNAQKDTTTGELKTSPLRWDDIRAGQPTQLHLFADEHPAAMFSRPGELTLDNWFHDGHMRTDALLNLSDVVRSVELQRGKGPVYMFGNSRVPQLLDRVQVTLSEEEFPKAGEPITLRELTSCINCQGILVVRYRHRHRCQRTPGSRHAALSIHRVFAGRALRFSSAAGVGGGRAPNRRWRYPASCASGPGNRRRPRCASSIRGLNCDVVTSILVQPAHRT